MASKKKIAVAGATGRLGRPTVEILRERGHEVVSISRGDGVDVISGEGLPAALDGVDLIIDAATGPSHDQAEATEFFATSTRNLQQAGAERGVEGMLVVSIIGTDHFNTGYNAAKVAQERTQLVAARSVAEALVDLVDETDSAPLGNPIAEVAGPREESLLEAARLPRRPGWQAACASRLGSSSRIRKASIPPAPSSRARWPSSPAPPTRSGSTISAWPTKTLHPSPQRGR